MRDTHTEALGDREIDSLCLAGNPTIARLATELRNARGEIKRIKAVVDEQADDMGLWVIYRMFEKEIKTSFRKATTMTRDEFEQQYRVKIRDKSECWTMRATSVFMPGWFLSSFLTTYRWPWQKVPTIALPVNKKIHFDSTDLWLMEHEAMHADQMRTFLGLVWTAVLYVLLPLPVYFSGRWFIERGPYLHDIKAEKISVHDAVDSLWKNYAKPWPRWMMRRWFEKNA